MSDLFTYNNHTPTQFYYIGYFVQFNHLTHIKEAPHLPNFLIRIGRRHIGPDMRGFTVYGYAVFRSYMVWSRLFLVI